MYVNANCDHSLHSPQAMRHSKKGFDVEFVHYSQSEACTEMKVCLYDSQLGVCKGTGTGLHREIEKCE